MADEREGYGTIGKGSDINTRSGFGAGEVSSTRTGFGGTETGGARGFSAGGDVDESGFEGTDTGTRSTFDRDDAGTRASSFDRKFNEERSGASGGVEEKAHTGRGRIADQLQRVGDRIEERARHLEEAGGVQRRAGRVVHRAGEALDTGADYIRNHEVNEMRDDLESAIRDRPLLSVGIAIGAGFLLARLMRD